jgi:glucose-fructose oxidoreductase
MAKSGDNRKIRYAVAGLGHIAQSAVLPAFRNAGNCELAALISGDRDKLRALAGRYGIKHAWTYEEFDAGMQSGEIDAVYIALPNDLHREYAVRAAHFGIHVLTE